MEYSKEMIDFLRDNIRGTSYKRMTELFNERFGLNLSKTAIAGTLKRNGLQNGNDTRFQKNSDPYNKGQKVTQETYEKIKRTMFKKGNRPGNALEVGSEVVTRGCIRVKIAEPNVWERKQILVWKEHYGEIPKGMVITFRNGNTLDCRIENLMCVTRGANAVANKLQLPKQARETSINIANILIKTNELKKRKKREDI